MGEFPGLGSPLVRTREPGGVEYLGVQEEGLHVWRGHYWEVTSNEVVRVEGRHDWTYVGRDRWFYLRAPGNGRPIQDLRQRGSTGA